MTSAPGASGPWPETKIGRMEGRAAMRLGLIIVFIIFPLFELALLIRAGQLIGLWPTLAIVMATAAAGAIILHRQGFAMMHRAMRAVEEGRPPVDPLVDGVFLVLAGVLLVAPGLITDTVGLLLLIPPFRRLIARRSLEIFVDTTDVHIEVTTRGQRPGQSRDGPSPDSVEGGPVIEGEFEELDKTPSGRALRKPRDRNQGH